MPSKFGVQSVVGNGNDQSALGGPGVQDTTQLLQKIMFGRVVGAPAFPYGGVSAVVVKNPNPSQVEVTIHTFPPKPDPNGLPTPTFTANYEPRPQAGNVPPQPPVGTPCFIVFAANGDHTPWVMAFSGWPS